MSVQINNVIVFGDSLSDIGIKWAHGMGWVADNLLGKITVNASGRFSDCRNWTDFMYEEAAHIPLVTGDAKQTVASSKVHQKLSQKSEVKLSQTNFGPTNFYYANYAEGGATGGKPANFAGKMGLNEFKDQVEQFRKEYEALNKPGDTLFLIWFGANDLYTAKCEPGAMADVAEKVAKKRRNELKAIIEASKCKAHFIFMNLGLPDSAPRFQERAEQASLLHTNQKKLSGVSGKLVETFGTNAYKASERRSAGYKAARSIEKLKNAAELYNASLRSIAGANGDAVVDIAKVIAPASINAMLDDLGLTEGYQAPQPEKKWGVGNKKQWVDVNQYDNAGTKHVTTADKAHPTDRVYSLIWKKIKETITEKEYRFGYLNLDQTFARQMIASRQKIAS